MSRATIDIESIVETEEQNTRDENEKRVIELYKKGTRVIDIIEEEGLAGTHVIYGILKRNNIPLRRERYRTTEKKNEQWKKKVVKEYKAGKSLKQITESNGITAPTIYRVLRDHKVKLRVDYTSDESKPTQPIQPIQTQERVYDEQRNKEYNVSSREIETKNNLIRERDKTITSLKKTLKVAIGLNTVALIIFITYAIMVI